MDRRTEILKHITKEQKGIEIGPWFAPLAPKRDGYHCLSFDVFDTERLKANATRDPNIDKNSIEAIETVDIVGSSTEIEDVIASTGGLGSFDYIISSHNFEHLPNPIKFLQGCAKVLKPGGYLSMAVPDKRACFDYFRPISTLAEWVEAHIENRTRPTLTQWFEQNSLHSRYHNNGAEQAGFSVENDPSDVFAKRTLREAYEEFVALHGTDNQTYLDTHCWVFTPSSLHSLLLEVRFLGLSQFSIAEVSESRGVEFYVHLCNSGTAPLEPESFYSIRQQLLHAIVNEESFNSIDTYNFRVEATDLQNEVALLRTELQHLRTLVGDIKRSMTWRAISPLWRLETRGQRKSRRLQRPTGS